MKKIITFLVMCTCVLALGLAISAQPAYATTGTIILEGSDAIGYHCPYGNASSCAYRDQAWSAIGGSDPRPIAVIGNNVNHTATGSGTHTVDNFASIAAAATAGGESGLGAYVALYFLAGNGCCEENDSLVTGNESAISAFYNSGGTVMIENYTGGAAWDFLIGAGGNGNKHVGGVGGGYPSSLSCDDGETVTAAGLANGFTQPSYMGCWTHQGYDPAYFSALGFTKSYFDAPTGVGIDGWSSLLANGNTVTGGGNSEVPEPGTLTLLGTGLVGLLGAVRRKINL